MELKFVKTHQRLEFMQINCLKNQIYVNFSVSGVWLGRLAPVRNNAITASISIEWSQEVGG